MGEAEGTTFVQVSAGCKHTCGVTSKGLVKCVELRATEGWTIEASKATPFVQVSAGCNYPCGVTSEGRIRCKSDHKGKDDGHKPKKASNGTFVQVSAGSEHTCVFTSEGYIECFINDNMDMWTRLKYHSKKWMKEKFLADDKGPYQSKIYGGLRYKLRVYQQPGSIRVGYAGNVKECEPNYYSLGGYHARCVPCKSGYKSKSGSAKCEVSQFVAEFTSQMQQITKSFAASKNYEQDINSGQVNKLQRMVATADV
eukprot:g7656.t1